ncbi:MAG: hypothetical protein WC943_01835 [Elusimicrobiota bacterium]|jgi:hypothetical protein
MNSQQAAAALAQGLSGVVSSDETWGGKVRVAAEVVIEAGATLRIAAGTRIVCESPSSRLLVRGGLIVEGVPGAQASICGPVSWGGVVCSGGRLVIDGLEVRGAAAGLVLTAGEAEVRSLRIMDCKVGMILSGGRGGFADLTVEGPADIAVHASAGRHRFFRYSGPPIVVEDRAEVSVDDRLLSGAGPAWSQEDSLLLRFVLATNKLPGFRQVYAAGYHAGERAFRLLAALVGNVVSCSTWRGWKAGDLIPGVSDLDFVVIARSLTGESGKSWLQGFWKAYGRLKAVFPIIGETVVMTGLELDAYLSHGGVRSGELSRALGRKSASRPAELKCHVASWTECAYAYSRLIEWLLHRPAYPWAFRRAQLFKAGVDLLRHLPSGADSASLVPSRRAFWEGMGAAAECRAPLQELLNDQEGSAGKQAELWALLLGVMHRSAADAEDLWSRFNRNAGDLSFEPLPGDGSGGGYGATLERWSPQLEGLRGQFGASLSGALLSDLYPSYAILADDSVSGPGLGRSLAGAGPEGGVTILLSRRLWRLWRGLAFFENPVASLDNGAAQAGRLVPARCQFAWGDISAPPPPPALVLEASQQALSHFTLVRRWLAAPSAALNARAAFHYLLSRSMGLRLLSERRTAVPFFNLDHLSRVYLREFPGEARLLSSIAPEAGGRTAEHAYWACHDFVESALEVPKR